MAGDQPGTRGPRDGHGAVLRGCCSNATEPQPACEEPEPAEGKGSAAPRQEFIKSLLSHCLSRVGAARLLLRGNKGPLVPFLDPGGQGEGVPLTRCYKL